ncbi:NAD(P)-dependent oxidoreductase [Lachnospiraceae bacterium 62-35]
MKILLLSDDGIKKAAFEKAAAQIPGGEVVVEEITEYGMEALQIIETQGPSAVVVPEGLKRNRDAEIIIGSITCPFSREVIEMFPNLKIIGLCRAGIENIDMACVKERGITVVNGLGRNAEAVSDFTMAIMLSEIRNVARSYHDVVTDKASWRKVWPSTPYLPHIKDCKVGILGFGMIGRLVAQKVSGFQSQVLICDPYVEEEVIRAKGYIPVDKETLFKEADIISIHARFVESTRGIVGRKEIQSMKPTAYFINTARAGLVDMEALLEALEQKKIGGAALDVFADEPLPSDSPWRTLDNCTVTAHMAGGVMAARDYAAQLVVSAVLDTIRGERVPQLITREEVETESFQTWAREAAEKIGLLAG